MSYPDVARQIQRGLDIPADEAQALLRRFLPVAIAADLSRPPSTNPVLHRPFLAGVDVASAAATPSAAAVRNPTNSGKYVVVEHAIIECDSAGTNLWGAFGSVGVWTLNDAGVTKQIQVTDGRSFDAAVTTPFGTNDQAAQLASGSLVYRLTAQGTPALPLYWLLDEGQEIIVETRQNNVRLMVTWVGVEIVKPQA